MVKRLSIDHPKVVKYAVNILAEGGVIVYPTDTLYGFGADATNEEAIEKIYSTKRRIGPMSVIAADKKMVLDWINISDEQIELVKPYLGGAQTLIIPVKDNIVCTKILGNNHTLGIRIPDNKFCNELSYQFGKPIISSSVNRTKEQQMNNPIKIEDEFGSEINLIIDSGTLPESKGSTIYQLKNNKIIVLRK